jgi:hypothetical protein
MSIKQMCYSPGDPQPTNGDPHPLYGPDHSAKQIYQHQVAMSLQQNQQHGAPGNNQGHQHVQFVNEPFAHRDAANVFEAADLPMADPPLFTFQAVLVEQGI